MRIYYSYIIVLALQFIASNLEEKLYKIVYRRYITLECIPRYTYLLTLIEICRYLGMCM
jgi:hypothetical protein